MRRTGVSTESGSLMSGRRSLGVPSLSSTAASTADSASSRAAGEREDAVSVADSGDEGAAALDDFVKWQESSSEGSVSNKKWKCNICSHCGTHRLRAVSHLEKHRNGNARLGQFLAAEASREKAREERKKHKAEHSTAEAESKARAAEHRGPMDLIALKDAKVMFNAACAKLIVRGGLPFNFFEGESVREFIDDVVEIARTRAGVSLTKDSVVGRTAMKSLVLKECEESYADYAKTFLTAAERNKMTFVIDGRSNQKQDAMLFYGGGSTSGFLWLGGENAGPSKKSTSFLKNLIEDIISPEPLDDAKREVQRLRAVPFARHFYSTMQDSAAVCVSAGMALQDDETVSLVALFCSAHAFKRSLRGSSATSRCLRRRSSGPRSSWPSSAGARGPRRF